MTAPAALAAWLSIPQEDRDGVIDMLRTRADAGETARGMAEAAAAKSTSAARRVVRQKTRDAERANRALAAAAAWLASVEPGTAAATSIDLDAPVGGLGLTRRVERLLIGAGVTTVRGLIERRAIGFIMIRGFGPGCLREVKEALAAHGLHLAGGA